MTAPKRSFTEIAKVGQESVVAVVRIWADVTKASVEVITTGRSELFDSRRVAGLVFGFANQILDGQRALLSAMTTAATNGRPVVAEITKTTAATNGTVIEAAATTAIKAVETAKPAVEAVSEKAAETTKPAAKAPAKTVEAVADSPTVAAGPYGPGSHAPLADRSLVPAGFAIKGNDGSKLYHVPGSAFYKRTIAEVWFASAEAAEAAGFQRPASQR